MKLDYNIQYVTNVTIVPLYIEYTNNRKSKYLHIILFDLCICN